MTFRNPTASITGTGGLVGGGVGGVGSARGGGVGSSDPLVSVDGTHLIQFLCEDASLDDATELISHFRRVRVKHGEVSAHGAQRSSTRLF